MVVVAEEEELITNIHIVTCTLMSRRNETAISIPRSIY
jgi:hypothetical protein